MNLQLFRKFKDTIITLRFSILSIFITLFFIAILLLIIVNYSLSTTAMIDVEKKLMDETTADILTALTDEATVTQAQVDITKGLIEYGLLDLSTLQKYTMYTSDILMNRPFIRSIFWGDDKGNCFMALQEDNLSITTQEYNRNHIPATRTIYYRNPKGQIIKEEKSNDLSFDPRTRPWFILAKEAKKSVWTDVYPFKFDNYLGVTVASPIYNPNGSLKGVLGFDIRLKDIAKYIATKSISEHGVVFLTTKEGKLITVPGGGLEIAKIIDIHSLKNPWLIKSFELHKKNQLDEFDFTYQGKKYLAEYTLFPQFKKNDWLLGMVSPEDDFVGKLKKASFIEIVLGISILLIGLIVVSSLVTRLVTPINNLAKQTKKIKNFELEDDNRINSRINEIALLSDALYSMKLGLRSFQKYVPASLVRQLIKAGENAGIGGTKKTLVIFFSDIKNFTSLSEKMTPDLLLQHICEYFDELSKIIVSEQGTIDKYIGDSIMAFWGAPLPVENPAQHAALASLKCKERLNELNKIWRDQGKYPLDTRIGVHVGEVVVGNVGSSERINYTAIGDAINVASRLEQLGKIYGTQILVSDTLYKIIKNQFVFRKIDNVIVKGKVERHIIYELLAENKKELSFDIDSYQTSFDKGFNEYEQQHWSDAILHFENCLKIYPTDSVALVFMQRCREFKNHPPTHWDGAWKISS